MKYMALVVVMKAVWVWLSCRVKNNDFEFIRKSISEAVNFIPNSA